MRSSVVFVAALWCALTSATGTWATEAEEESAAIRARVESYVQAYNQHDATAVASLWAEDAVYVDSDTGQRHEGRAAIEGMFLALFQSDEASQLAVTIDSIRLITPDVAIEDGRAQISSGGGEPLSTSYTAVHVKQKGQWYLDSVRETDIPAEPLASNSQLDSLAWLVGEWLDQDEFTTVRTRWDWVRNRHFLSGTFSVSSQQNVELEGTQIIGWDPVSGQIRSWMFDSEGGFGEGRWWRVGNQWIVELSTTLRDGSQGSSVSVYTLMDDRSFTWKSVDRQIDGEPLPDIEAVTVYRQ